MKIIIFIEGEYRIQPFMINELEAASLFFDKVFIVTKEMTSDISTTILNNSKIKQIQVTQKERLRSRIKNIYRLFTPFAHKQLKEAYKNNVLCLDYLKIIYRHLSDGDLFYRKVMSILKGETNDNDELYVISTWFSIEALSVSFLKNKLSNIHAYSFAHSFEIDKKKDRYIAYYFNKYKHELLDGIIFISKTMIDVYLDDTDHKYDGYSDKFHVEYLGSNKKYPSNNPAKTEESFTICSCSNVIPIKNLDLILDMLSSWKGQTIKWVHFGGGETFEKISERAREVQSNNGLVQIELKGVTPNDQVQCYYSSRHIDAFINVSISEGLPVSLMEAISYGIPIIATDVGGTKEIVQDSHGILLSSNPTASELKNAINIVMLKSDDEIKDMREHAFNYWCQFFNAKKNMESFYARILEHN